MLDRQILYSGFAKAWGGSTISGRTCYDELAKIVNRVDAITNEFEAESNVRNGYCFHVPAVHPGYGRGVLRLLRALRSSVKEWRRMEKERKVRERAKYDLIIANDPNGHQMLAELDLENAHPNLMILRLTPDYMGGYQAQGRGEYDRARSAWGGYDYYVAISRAVADTWKDTGLLDNKKCWIIPNCGREYRFNQLIEQSREQVRRRLGLPLKEQVLVCPGSVQYRKGQDQFLRAMRLLPDSLKQSIHCYCLGPLLGHYAGALAACAAKMGMNHFVFPGARNNVLDYIYAADLVIVPSRSEGQGLVVLESMALKTPVIASARGGIPEMIDHGTHGLLFDPDEPEQIAAAIEVCMAHPTEARIRAEAACERYWREFSKARYSEKWRKLMEEIL